MKEEKKKDIHLYLDLDNPVHEEFLKSIEFMKHKYKVSYTTAVILNHLFMAENGMQFLGQDKENNMQFEFENADKKGANQNDLDGQNEEFLKMLANEFTEQR